MAPAPKGLSPGAAKIHNFMTRDLTQEDFARNKGLLPDQANMKSEKEVLEERIPFVSEHYTVVYNLRDAKEAHKYSEVYKRIAKLVNAGKCDLLDRQKVITPDGQVLGHLEWMEFGLRIKVLETGKTTVEQEAPLSDMLDAIDKELNDE